MNDKNLNLKEIYALAVENQQKGNLQTAEDLYLKILNELPNHINTKSNLGALYVQIGKKEKAKSILQSILETEPNNINVNANLGVVLNQLLDYEKAIECHKKILQIDPKNSDAHNNLAINYRKLGETELAKNHYYKAIEINPNHANAYNNLGSLLAQSGEYDKAIDVLKKASGLVPNFFKAQTNIATVYINQQKNMEKAIIESQKALSMHHKLSKINNQSIPLYRFKHDVEQSEYLQLKKYKINGLNTFNEIGKEILSRKENKEYEGSFLKKVFLKDNEIESLLPFYKAEHIYNSSVSIQSCLNPNKDWAEIEKKYFNSKNQIIYIDDFLSKEAIKEMRDFCLISKIWIHQNDNKYLGAYSDSGFISPMHLKLGEELQKKLPNLFGKYNIGKFWAYKYDTTLGEGIGIHADFAYLNLNFWITPDKYNNKNGGGLIVYDAPAPENWSFEKYNSESKEIYKFLKEENANCEIIPYKFNRAVLFNSAYFHETDKIDFEEGYESRRINITYLFGVRQIKKK